MNILLPILSCIAAVLASQSSSAFDERAYDKSYNACLLRLEDNFIHSHRGLTAPPSIELYPDSARIFQSTFATNDGYLCAAGWDQFATYTDEAGGVHDYIFLDCKNHSSGKRILLNKKVP